jgi:hypothetical protein
VTGGSGVASGGVDPSRFTHPKTNPYFPLVPGTILHYRGSEDGERLHERLSITHTTRMIAGVETVVIRDVLHSQGRLAEATTDWYQADNDGNVWYFGENTATYDAHGDVESREGTWRAGVHGAVAGIIMPANPGPTDAYRQEFLRGHAEDQAWIVQRGARVRVPIGNLDQVVRSFEWTRLEPNVVSLKFYAPHVGIVLERDVAGGNELVKLVSVRRP